MRDEDIENKFLSTIRAILQRNFDLTKKFMQEKNAKLDMIYKMKLRAQTKVRGYGKPQAAAAEEEVSVKKKGCCSGLKKGNRIAINDNEKIQ